MDKKKLRRIKKCLQLNIIGSIEKLLIDFAFTVAEAEVEVGVGGLEIRKRLEKYVSFQSNYQIMLYEE